MDHYARRLLDPVWFGLLAYAAACGSSPEDSTGAPSGGQSGMVINSSGARAGSGGATDSGVRSGVLPGQECAAEMMEGEFLPLDMFVMMDQSVSMGDSLPIYLIPGGGEKWEAVREGFASFVGDPGVTGVGMGIAFFGLGNNDATRCDPETYATAEVPIAPLPGVGPGILAAYDRHAPDGNTPLTPALEGAIAYARQYKSAHPGRNAIVTLVTDGFPNGCASSLANLEAAAATGLAGSPPVQTFVLGIAGQELSPDEFRTAMQATAQAGGTEAVLVYANTDLATEFARGLNAIRDAAALPCTFGIPPETGRGQVDFSLVNVVYQSGSGDSVPILNVPNVDGCGSGQGWYYDNPAAPAAFQLCPASCALATSASRGSIQVILGCKTQTSVQ
jgi:hypothetical protein